MSWLTWAVEGYMCTYMSLSTATSAAVCAKQQPTRTGMHLPLP
jgi:hypothetical protein